MKTIETIKHIREVQKNISMCISKLMGAMIVHDKSKLESPEVEIISAFEDKIDSVVYGSQEYNDILKQMAPALEHHYQVNSHHPEHYGNGIQGMNLIDILEMICDWEASTRRYKDGDIYRSIELNQKRFGYSDELKSILINTVNVLRGK